MAHVEQLAEQGAVAEVWVQHSDRLACGDGRSARNAVEIALWALKREVSVRTIQNPDTFRDLLYAVVSATIAVPSSPVIVGGQSLSQAASNAARKPV
jgi:hypothetical protein